MMLRYLGMISIVISSSNPGYLTAVKENVRETIGVPYEVITVPNGDGKRGICEVYNAAAAQAKFDILCFMHEDIQFHTQDWGHNVVEVLSNPKVGLLGVAGSKYKSLMPGGWSCPGISIPWHKANFIQRFKFEDLQTQHFVYNTSDEQVSEVATLDGVWLCTRKTVFKTIKFDEQLLRGFHGYDLDYSLQVARQYKVCVTFGVLIEHFSEGNYSADWLDAMLKLHNKHKDALPRIVGDIPAREIRYAEKSAGKALFKKMAVMGYGLSDRIAILWKYDARRALGLKQFLLFNLKLLVRRY